MARLLTIGLTIVSVVGVAAGKGQAQTSYGSPCCTGCGVPAASVPVAAQSYQRFSYSPAPAGASSSAAYSQSVQSSVPMNGQPPVQSYRNYSYGPSYSGGRSYSQSVGELWRYPKGDPRRQMH
ncbi:MAG: hypothetical protein ACTHK7_02565 [Aureliella sp.]